LDWRGESFLTNQVATPNKTENDFRSVLTELRDLYFAARQQDHVSGWIALQEDCLVSPELAFARMRNDFSAFRFGNVGEQWCVLNQGCPAQCINFSCGRRSVCLIGSFGPFGGRCL
jgi:hypothetical protein